MSTKHMVRSARHSAHRVPRRKHATHTAPSGEHAAHMVPSGTNTAGEMRPFESLGAVIEDLLDFPMAEVNAINTPTVDIRETNKTIEVSVALTGAGKKDINLDLTEDSLAISCELRGEKDEKGAGGYRLQERSYGRFYRAFFLPAAIKPGDAKAGYKNGVLRITMPKQKPDNTRHLKVG